MPEYAVLDKDTIKIWIMPYLSVAKRGYTSKFDLPEIVNAILYKLRTGCRWRNTVTTYRRNISAKLNSHSAAGLTVFAILHRLVDINDLDPHM